MKRVIATALVAALVCACYVEEDYTGNPSGPRVAVVGDADMETVASALHAELDGTYSVKIAGNEMTTPEMEQIVTDYLDPQDAPDVFVFMPPWLDVDEDVKDVFEIYGFTAGMGDPTQGIRSLTLDVGACYVFGTLTYDRADVDEANDILRSPEMASMYPDVVIADWDAEVNANPSYQDAMGNVTSVGEAALVEVISDAVAEC